MESLADALLRLGHRSVQPQYDPDFLRSLPPTERVQAGLDAIMEKAASYGPEEANAPVRIRSELAKFRRTLAAAQERDRLQASRPEGCWCFGGGGDGERVVLLDTDSDDLPTVLSRYCCCPEADARRAADAALREQGQRFARQLDVDRMWRGMGIPDRFDGCTLDTYPRSPQTAPVVAAVRTWLDGPGWVLVLSGAFGTGKTGLAVGVLRAAAERSHAGLFVKVPDMLTRLQATYGKNPDGSELEVLRSLRDVAYLALDDLGAEKDTEWAQRVLFQVLDDRHDHERKTVITTNLSVAQLEGCVGERTMRRFEEGGKVLAVSGPNLRRQAA